MDWTFLAVLVVCLAGWWAIGHLFVRTHIHRRRLRRLSMGVWHVAGAWYIGTGLAALALGGLY
jgi:hypothetical protein